ncbi:tRNA (adenosine(37)-N6)-threonylcarbamoyltransferase complex dimerization subunit type 1 TsaB [Marinobacterium rhizophilum]|uniref:tRNA threonylcarbamoyladenosine biosynthesis protein TsaB n=1 Tax=Marinobacterium rhizophilum TaxID=420402 RepID=A0ABY5HS47_9GAMM|nr:tRNA (adenosine(37)-N6)-threonylcarbamoyltransferase complex dimerization subunit type 1 TsaB [Marinobacterium rhizophilum]UTW14042.1 tRNA (adenosine(37)-N6)-threonylcarbamoyltransferase complex dimerization subunit type 1 TsaB [Marinobacterium rhizophilum]
MSKILALDTSTDACSVALWQDGAVVEDFRVVPRKHIQLLLPMAEALLSEAGLSAGDLDAVAFGRGPGSFTGIRIATGIAQGLAFAADVPVLPISTLAAMALEQGCAQGQDRVIAALDARMDEIYWCAYRLEDGLPVALLAEQVCAASQLCLPQEAPWLGVGPGFNYLADMTPAVQAAITAPLLEVYPRASAMLPIAASDLAHGRGLTPEDGLPVYIREGGWKKKEQQ